MVVVLSFICYCKCVTPCLFGLANINSPCENVSSFYVRTVQKKHNPVYYIPYNYVIHLNTEYY